MTGTFLLTIHVIAFAISLIFVWGAFRIIWPSRHPGAPERLLHQLLRTDNNPLLAPTAFAWEAGGSFNPGAVLHGGRTHLFYRALGTDGVSRVGYAVSKNGTHIDERLSYPVFSLPHAPQKRSYRLQHHAGLVASGGSWAGAEDPRTVILEERLYLSFSAFAGWDSVRIGVVSLSLDDLEERNWDWSEPVFLSAPNEVHKNWIVFPKRINGKIVVLHGLHGDSDGRVRVAYLDSLDHEPSSYIQSAFTPRRDPSRWDYAIRGGGPPPIETPYGWLVLYHATSADEPHRYKIGALLLDKDDPSCVIGRLPYPVLAPDAHYENEGAKAGVVYACGAVTDGDTLRIYYGGADSVVCTGTVSLSGLAKQLVS